MLLLATIGATVAACSSPVSTNMGGDAGGGAETSVGTDTGPAADRGPATDAGFDGGRVLDAGPGVDGGPAKDGGPGTDAGPTGDRGPTVDRPAPVDAGPPVDPCTMGSVVDLNMMGMRTGATTRITRSNAMTPRFGTLRAPCQSNTGGQVAFRYTPTATGRLFVSTDNAGTSMGFDTVAWAQSSCAALPSGDAGTGSLGCSDDDGVAPRGLASRFTTTVNVTMGTPVFIIVAGFSAQTGSFELSVSEVTTAAIGAACEVGGGATACITGSLCVASATPGMATCVADGTLGGACRMMGDACAAGLACSGLPSVSTSRCRTAVTAGAACDPTRVMNVCAGGAACITSGMASTCVAGGVMNAGCRPTGMACDAGLACNGDPTSPTSRCRTAAAIGAACDSARVTNACVAGSSCLTNAGVTACVADGTQNGACRATGAACDGTLGCSGPVASTASRCRTTVAVGAACDPTRAMNICAMDGSCTQMGSAFTCVAAGGLGAACRAAAPRCDTGLDCSTMMGAGICRRTGGAGAACVPASTSELCATGTACRPATATTGTCAMGVAETEPNNTPMTAQAAVATSAVYSGTATMTDEDCFAVTVAMGASLYAESNLPATPACLPGGPDPVIDLYGPTNMPIGGVDDTAGRGLCGTVSGTRTAALRNLAAGRYSVCIRAYNAMPINYLLTVGVYPTP